MFEPHEYDKINNVTDEYKESIKVGFNLKRKVVLISLWLGSTAFAYYDPTLLGTIKAYTNFSGFLDNLAIVWAIVAIGGKILTEPVYNLPVYYKAPFLALKGDMIDPMTERR